MSAVIIPSSLLFLVLFLHSSLLFCSLSCCVLQLGDYSSLNSTNMSTVHAFLSKCSFSRASKVIHSVLPCSVPWGCSLHMCCLSFRSLLCAGGPFPPPEEARLLPHTDLHPSYYGCGALTSLFLDQQRVGSCAHSCWYTIFFHQHWTYNIQYVGCTVCVSVSGIYSVQ